MTLPHLHPHFGKGSALNEAMSDIEEDDDTEKARQGKRLAEAQDRIEKLETMVARLAGHVHEAQEMHDVHAGGLVDEAREVLDGEEGPHLKNITDLAGEVERLREAISKSKAELENVGQAGRPTAAAYNLLTGALAAEDGGDE